MQCENNLKTPAAALTLCWAISRRNIVKSFLICNGFLETTSRQWIGCKWSLLQILNTHSSVIGFLPQFMKIFLIMWMCLAWSTGAIARTLYFSLNPFKGSLIACIFVANMSEVSSNSASLTAFSQVPNRLDSKHFFADTAQVPRPL